MMFDTFIYKDSRRSPDQKIKTVSRKRLFEFKYDESALPYFELIPGKLLSDPRFSQLSPQDQGDFLRFVLLLWVEKGRYVRSAHAIAIHMRMEVCNWEALEKRLLDIKLLEISPDGAYIIQPGLRGQFLMNLQKNMNKKRLKNDTSATVRTTVRTTASTK